MPEKQVNWIVEVTYGTKQHQVYANVPSRDSALRLKERAISLGYRDARVVREKDFQAAQEAYRRNAANTGSVNREARPVHDLRGRSSAAASK